MAALSDFFGGRAYCTVKDNSLVTEISDHHWKVADEVYEVVEPFCKNGSTAAALQVALKEFFREHSWAPSPIGEPMTRITGQPESLVKYIYNLSYIYIFTTT